MTGNVFYLLYYSCFGKGTVPWPKPRMRPHMKPHVRLVSYMTLARSVTTKKETTGDTNKTGGVIVAAFKSTISNVKKIDS